jgi:hypothetical protein
LLTAKVKQLNLNFVQIYSKYKKVLHKSNKFVQNVISLAENK